MFSPVPDQVYEAALAVYPYPFPSYTPLLCQDLPFKLVSWWDHGTIVTVVFHAFSGVKLWGRSFRAARSARVSWRSHREFCMSFLRKLHVEPLAGGLRAAEEDGVLFAAYPAVLDHLIVTQVPGDPPVPRETCTLLMFAEEGVWKAMLRDRDTEATLWATGETPEGALAVLEGLLRLETPGWYFKKHGGGTRRKR